MDPEDRAFLTSVCPKLASVLDLSSQLMSFLILRHVFTGPMLADILNGGTETEKKERLVLELRKRGPKAFEKFISILVSTNQLEAASLLNGRNCQDGPEQLKNREGPSPKVRPAVELRIGPEFYKMTSNPRGKCLIINNINFEDSKNCRMGSESDGTGLKVVFSQLGYEVDLQCNKTASQIRQLLSDCAQDPKHELMDSCVVIILSHGHSGFIVGVDDEEVYYNSIFDLFDNEHCPALKEKPKMFFFQACRGKRTDCGVKKNVSADAANDIGIPQIFPRMPARTDMLIAYSTVDGYVALRDDQFGSWFCQELICTLVEEAWNTDLETILKHVNSRVQQRMAEDGEMQSTEWTNCGFNHTLFFNPGLYDP